MYKVETIIRPERLEEVTDVLLAQGFQEFTVLDAHEMPFVHRLRVELRVPDTARNLVVEAIAKAAHAGQPGDGKILVTLLTDDIEISLDRRTPARQHQSPPRPRLATTADAARP